MPSGSATLANREVVHLHTPSMGRECGCESLAKKRLLRHGNKNSRYSAKICGSNVVINKYNIFLRLALRTPIGNSLYMLVEAIVYDRYGDFDKNFQTFPVVLKRVKLFDENVCVLIHIVLSSRL